MDAPRLGLVLALAAAACGRASPGPVARDAGVSRPSAPRSSWPERLVYDRLALDRATIARQSYRLVPPAFDPRDPRLLRRHYWQPGPNGHGLGTEVVYLPHAAQFYLRSDCFQGHHDGFLGPFPGDPRRVLAPR
jgi:hypothetical protein